jgi:hypothetical protein
LAATVADRRIDAGQGPYLWLRAGSAEADVVLDAVARYFGVVNASGQPATGLERLRAIADAVAARGIGLVVIDDVWNSRAALTIMTALPRQIGVIVTSRIRLVVDHQLEVGELTPEAAVRLLAENADSHAYLAHPEAQALCREMGYHPYLIEIAGRHLRQYGYGPEELRVMIGTAPHELQMPANYAPEGRETVGRLLDRSYESLDNADARRAWSAFGAFATGTLTPELLSCYLDVPVGDALSALNALVDVSLAKRSDGVRCYAMHDITTAYARKVLGGKGSHAAPTVVVRAFVEDYAGRHDVLALDLGNVVATAELARQMSLEDDFVFIAETLAICGYVDTHGHTLELLRVLDAAIDFLRTTPDTARLHRLLSKRGNTCYNQGQWDEAISYYEEALTLAPTPQRQAIVLGVLGKVRAERGQSESSADCFRRAYAIVDQHTDDGVRLIVLEQHSVAAFRLENYPLVRDLAEQGIPISRRLCERAHEANFLINLGSALFHIGVNAALEHQKHAMAIAQETSDEHILATAHRSVGADYHALEKFEDARRHLAEALRLYQKLGQSHREHAVLQLMTQFGYRP